jgi:hypothetical protein
MAIGPLVAAAGTVVTIWVGGLLVPTAAVPLKVTTILVARVGSKFVTVMFTVAPTEELAGVNVGGASTVKLVADVAWETPSTVTLIGPLVAVVGTVVTIWVGVLLVTTAVVPLKVTTLLTGPTSKPVPVMVMVVPTVAPTGEKPEMMGEGLFPHPERKKRKQTSAPPALKSLFIHAPSLLMCKIIFVAVIDNCKLYCLGITSSFNVLRWRFRPPFFASRRPHMNTGVIPRIH